MRLVYGQLPQGSRPSGSFVVRSIVGGIASAVIPPPWAGGGGGGSGIYAPSSHSSTPPALYVWEPATLAETSTREREDLFVLLHAFLEATA